MILTTLVTGQAIRVRETAIAEALTGENSSLLPTALILEGIPDGCSPLDARTHPAVMQLARIAAGCACCTGNLTMRVTLNRILRHAPARLYISVANSAHSENLRNFLSQPPYTQYLVLTPDLCL